jgi:hypothetical protein
MLKCSFCQKLKSKTEFHKDCKQPSGYKQRYKVCSKYVLILKKEIKKLTPYEKRKKLIELYIKHKQMSKILYRLFECDFIYISNILKEENIRWCLKCNKLKTYDDFYIWTYSSDGYKQDCKECSKIIANKAMKKSYNKNPEKKRQKNKIWFEENKEHHRKNIMEYYRKNKDLYRHANRKRQLIKKNATPKWANLEKIKEIYKEARRLEFLDNISRHVDHIIPLQGDNICGLHVENNLQILTSFENLSKSNKF